MGGGEVSVENSREEETQSQSVWGVLAQSVCEGGILKKCARAVFLLSDTGRGPARFGPRVGPTGQRAWRAGLSRVDGLNFWTQPMYLLTG